MNKPSKPLGQIIAESARGEHDGWPIDPTYPAELSHEEGFKAGDTQRVLWQLYDCAANGTPIPEWAATAFRDRLSRIAQCELSWEEAFGKVPAVGFKKSTIQKLSKNLVRVGEAVQAYAAPKDETMRATLSKRLALGRGIFIKYWRRYKSAHRAGARNAWVEEEIDGLIAERMAAREAA